MVNLTHFKSEKKEVKKCLCFFTSTKGLKFYCDLTSSVFWRISVVNHSNSSDILHISGHNTDGTNCPVAPLASVSWWCPTWAGTKGRNGLLGSFTTVVLGAVWWELYSESISPSQEAPPLWTALKTQLLLRATAALHQISHFPVRCHCNNNPVQVTFTAWFTLILILLTIHIWAP